MTEHKHGEMNIEEQEKIFVKTMKAIQNGMYFTLRLMLYLKLHDPLKALKVQHCI